jgi:hypothetical protein
MNFRIAAATFLALFVASSQLDAQVATRSAQAARRLAAGAWTGELLIPNMTIPAAVNVAHKGDTTELSLVMTPPDSPAPVSLTAIGVSFAGDTVVFTLLVPQAAVGVGCRLLPKAEGAYSGTCSMDGREPATLTMKPPKALE